MPATGFVRANAAHATDDPSELRTTANVRKPSGPVLITLCAVQATISTATSQIVAAHRASPLRILIPLSPELRRTPCSERRPEHPRALDWRVRQPRWLDQ